MFTYVIRVLTFSFTNVTSVLIFRRSQLERQHLGGSQRVDHLPTVARVLGPDGVHF